MVWLAYDERLDDQVAIKVLAEEWAGRLDVRERFEREARILRRARSHRVVEVFDIDELPDGRPYFVMTYADRGSLADLLAEGPLPVEQALRYGAELARGVGDLHAAGVLHRDIKPSNVLFRSAAERPRLLIADLGLSRDMARGSRLTLAAGTPGYMAPEQDGLDPVIDQRVDVFGVGATVYHALTGRVPDQPPSAPSTLRPGLPEGTDAVVLRALAVDPQDRWATAADLVIALGRLAAREPISPPRRRVPVAVLLMTALVGVLALAGVAVLQWAPWQSRTVSTTVASTPTFPPPVTRLHGPSPSPGLQNCQHSKGSGSPITAQYVRDTRSQGLIGSIQLCRDSAHKYWAYLVLYDPPVSEGAWADATLETWFDGKSAVSYTGSYSCAATGEGASGYLTPTSTRRDCWTRKVDGTDDDTRFTFLARASVCVGPYHSNPTTCFGEGLTVRRR